MSKPLILLLTMLAVLAAAVAGVYYYSRNPETPTQHVVKYGGSARDFILEYFKNGHDANSDGRLSYEEFAKGYNDFRLNKSEREVYDVKEAFKMLDANADGVLDKDDIAHFEKRRAEQEAMKRREDLAKEGLMLMSLDGREAVCNPVQRQWLDAEEGALKRSELPYAGAYFARKWLGQWEEIARPGLTPLYRLKQSYWARLRFTDGKIREAFVRETQDAAAAEKEGLAPGKVYALGYDARIDVFAADSVAAVEYFAGSVQEMFVKAAGATAVSDSKAQLELARQCLKDGLNADALTLYRRVLVFEQGNEEALAALGYKLNGRQYVKVK